MQGVGWRGVKCGSSGCEMRGVLCLEMWVVGGLEMRVVGDADPYMVFPHQGKCHEVTKG